MKTILTIIICTYDRGDVLKDCLESLSLQEDQNFDLLIVDNGLTRQGEQCANYFLEHHPKWRFIKCCDVGLSYARNCGVEESDTEWVGYLDDDATVKSDFINQVKNVIKRREFDAFGGVYYPWYREGRKKWYSDKYGGNAHAYLPLKRRELHQEEFFSGGIAFYKKEIIKSVGGFNPNLGMKGLSVAYGEETELQNILREKGYKLGIAPEVSMNHLVAQYKLSLKWQIVANYQKGKAVYRISGNPNKIKVFMMMIPRAAKVALRVNASDYDSRTGCLMGRCVEFIRMLALNIGIIKG